jgi:plasmid stabilization system protein ParE
LFAGLPAKTQAQRYVFATGYSIAVLRDFPESAQARPEFGPDIRTIPVGRYIAFVRVIAERVTVLRILHGARDLPRLMKPTPSSPP